MNDLSLTAMDDVSATSEDASAAVGEGSSPAAELNRLGRWIRDSKRLVHYLLDSEVHTFAFSVAANAILSFIPFIVMLYTLAEKVFHSPSMVTEIGELVHYLFPSNQDFITVNLALLGLRHSNRWLSLVMILVACTGIFLPLEVALNKAWGVAESRNYLMNQLVALGLALWMVLLGLLAVLSNAVEKAILSMLFFGHVDNVAYRLTSQAWMTLTTGAASMLFFFSIYWLLPNRKVPWRPVLRVSIVTGVVWVAAKFLFVAALPRLDLHTIYGPFSVSVGLLLWAYVSGLLLFAGAQVSVHRHKRYTAAQAVRAKAAELLASHD